jgi:hypothetical protein
VIHGKSFVIFAISLFKIRLCALLVQHLLDAVYRLLGLVWLLAKYGYGYLMANLDFLTAEGLVLRLPRTAVAEPPRDGKLIEFLRSADLARLGGFPDSSVPYARSLLLLAAGDIEAAHRIAQESSSVDGAYVHGMIHRIEDDFDNARYWFFRAGVHPASPEIYRRAAANSQRIASHPTWDAGGVTDWLEESRVKGIGEELRAVLRIESEVLLEHFTGEISG